jgi:hypothetical protein
VNNQTKVERRKVLEAVDEDTGDFKVVRRFKVVKSF